MKPSQNPEPSLLDRLDHLSQFQSVTARACKDAAVEIRQLRQVISQMNHMGGDDRGGYCICPRHDGSAPDHEHATVCADARAALRR